MPRLGIDFGTCYSSAALLLEGVLTPISAPLTLGYSLPSSVFITERREILVGQAAENNRRRDLTRYRREFKRDLGSKDPYRLGDTSILPKELVTQVLRKLKSEAEKVIQGTGEKSITDALITVPVTYSLYKRDLMQEAGKRAGFSNVKLLDEPVAAAIYYSQSHDNQIEEGDIILVYDLGGGTFDATLMQKEGDKYQFLGRPQGLPNCGGTDFDGLIYQHLKKSCSERLRQQLEPEDALLARAIVLDLCRDLKHQLSEEEEVSIYIPIGLEEVEAFELTRKAFNEMISPLIDEILDCCEQLVRSANKGWKQVNQILLVGGSSRIPYVKEAIEKRFGISPLLVDQPELAVCLGAALYGNWLENEGYTARKKAEVERYAVGDNYTQLRDLLATKKWKEADKETASVMLKVAGCKSRYLNSYACHNFPKEALCTIDQLWLKYSNGNFGFSVQKKIWIDIGGKLDGSYDYDTYIKLADQVGWRKKEHWLNYDQLTFNTNAPVGHLPGVGGVQANGVPVSYWNPGCGRGLVCLGGGWVHGCYELVALLKKLA